MTAKKPQVKVEEVKEEVVLEADEAALAINIITNAGAGVQLSDPKAMETLLVYGRLLEKLKQLASIQRSHSDI